MSTSMLSIRVRVEDARQALAQDRGALRRLLGAAKAALATKDRRAQAPKKVRPTPRPPPSGRWSTKKLRLAVWERSEGHCENSDCGARITWSTFDLDHYLGRARASQTPENTWALCRDCHDRKHAGAPSRVAWHRVYLRHLGQHGFGRSETAAKVRAELEAEELIAQAEAISARAVTSAQNLATRAGNSPRPDGCACPPEVLAAGRVKFGCPAHGRQQLVVGAEVKHG